MTEPHSDTPERQSERPHGLHPRTQHLTSPNIGYLAWAACAVIFIIVGAIIGAVTQ